MSTNKPWHTEQDRVQWRDEATGFELLVKRAKTTGALCGYVGVPPGHPWHGKDYDSIDAEVHGGVTYSEACDGDQEHGICHVPRPGEPEHLWWIGFDCAHLGDFTPGTAAHYPDIGSLNNGVYRDMAYVRGQCIRLARQAKEADS
jgi:hypothetical protein